MQLYDKQVVNFLLLLNSLLDIRLRVSEISKFILKGERQNALALQNLLLLRRLSSMVRSHSSG